MKRPTELICLRCRLRLPVAEFGVAERSQEIRGGYSDRCRNCRPLAINAARVANCESAYQILARKARRRKEARCSS